MASAACARRDAKQEPTMALPRVRLPSGRSSVCSASCPASCKHAQVRCGILAHRAEIPCGQAIHALDVRQACRAGRRGDDVSAVDVVCQYFFGRHALASRSRMAFTGSRKTPAASRWSVASAVFRPSPPVPGPAGIPHPAFRRVGRVRKPTPSNRRICCLTCQRATKPSLGDAGSRRAGRGR